MIGRLVEEKNIWFAGERPADRGTAALATRCRGCLAIEIDSKLVGNGFHLMARRRTFTGDGEIA